MSDPLKIPIFTKKKKFSSYHGSFIINKNKNVFFFKPVILYIIYYKIVKKINDVVFCIQKTSKYKKKIIHIDRLATYHDR